MDLDASKTKLLPALTTAAAAVYRTCAVTLFANAFSPSRASSLVGPKSLLAGTVSRSTPYACVFFAVAASLSAAGLPDLTIYAPAATPNVIYRTFATDDCTVNEGCVVPGVRRLLSFETDTRNVGSADLILGNPATNSLFVWDPCHMHYHYAGFAEYRLRDSNATVVVLGRKIGFCVEDVRRWDPNAPTNRIYDCNYQGIQKGWADVYDEGVPCQWIDVTDVPTGNYILEMEINPEGTIIESNYGNNIVQLPIFIPPACASLVANDDFANAQQIPRSPISFTTFNGCASKEQGEPWHAGNAGGHSVWWKGTAITNGLIRVTTEGSDFDTLLAVYTGSSVDQLSLVASNDDIVLDVNQQSSLSFNAVGGTLYYIAVDGYDGAVGTVVLNIDPPLNNAFTNCQVLSGLSGQTTGYNIGATKEPGEPDHNGDFGGHSVWYCWQAPATGPVSFDTIGSDFDTLLAVYTGSAVNALTAVVSDNDSGGNLTSRVSFNAANGQMYRIAIDGVQGATGDLNLHWVWNGTNHLTVHEISATSMGLVLTGWPGTYSLEASGDLRTWSALATLTLTGSGSTAQYTDNAAGAFRRRFYRTKFTP